MAGVLLATVVLATDGSASGASPCAGVHALGGGWSLIDPPAMPESAGVPGALGPYKADLVDLATVSGQPSTILATDGGAIFRSADSGCTWTSTYTLVDDVPYYYSVMPYYIARLASPRPVAGRAPSGRVYALVLPALEPAFATTFATPPPIRVLSSTDGGATFATVTPAPTASASAWPRCLSSQDVSVSPVDPNVIYLLCTGGLIDQTVTDPQHGASYAAYRSDNGGASWAQLEYPVTFAATTLVSDPLQASVLWTIGGGANSASRDQYLTAWRSHDAGMSWTAVQMPKPGVSGINAWSISVGIVGGKVRALASSWPAGMYESTDGAGRRWRPVPVNVKGVTPIDDTNALANGERDILMTTSWSSCSRQLSIRRIPLRGHDTVTKLPAAARAWGPWRALAGGNGLIGIALTSASTATPCPGRSPQRILRWRPPR